MATFKRSLLFLAYLAVGVVNATQVMHRPATYKEPPATYAIEENPTVNTIQKRDTGKASMAYFTNWGIYAANFRECSSVTFGVGFFSDVVLQSRKILLQIL